MQIPGLTQVQALPSPPLVQRLVLEEPLTLTVVFVGAAVVGFWILDRGGKTRRAMWCAAVGVALAAGVQVLSRLVTTDRERIMAATEELVRVTSHAETATLRALLASEVRLTNEFNLSAREIKDAAWDREAILANVQNYLRVQYPLKETAILEVQGVMDWEGSGRTQVRVRAVPEGMGFPIISWWRIEWVKKDGAWVVKGIEPMDLGL